MSNQLSSYGIASYVTDNVLIVPFQADFYEDVIFALQGEILGQLHANPSIKGLIIDLSKIKIIDLKNMKNLEETIGMGNILGVQAYLSGMQPQVTLSLVELGYQPEGLKFAINIETAINLILEGDRMRKMSVSLNECSDGHD